MSAIEVRSRPSRPKQRTAASVIWARRSSLRASVSRGTTPPQKESVFCLGRTLTEFLFWLRRGASCTKKSRTALQGPGEIQTMEKTCHGGSRHWLLAGLLFRSYPGSRRECGRDELPCMQVKQDAARQGPRAVPAVSSSTAE